MAGMEHDRGREQTGFSIEELAEAADVPVRTVRFYIAEGLLPGPGTRGKAAVYRQEHLARLRLIRLLARQRTPLAEIGELLGEVDDAAVDELLAREERRSETLERQAQEPSPQAYIAALLENARAARTPSASTGAPAFRVREPSPYGKRSKGGVRPSGPAEEVWYRLELMPGVELHVSADVWRRYATLIERLRELAERTR